jgi:hypothetical protein
MQLDTSFVNRKGGTRALYKNPQSSSSFKVIAFVFRLKTNCELNLFISPLGPSTLVRTENQTFSLIETNGFIPCLVSNSDYLPSLFEISPNGTRNEIRMFPYDSRQGFQVPLDKNLEGKLLACTHGNVTKFLRNEGKLRVPFVNFWNALS